MSNVLYCKMINLFDQKGNRKYLVASERERFLIHARESQNEVRTFCLLLYYTGVRISEGLELHVSNVDYPSKAIVTESLKKEGRESLDKFPFLIAS